MKNGKPLRILGLCAVMVIFTIFIFYGIQKDAKSVERNRSFRARNMDDFLFDHYQSLSIKQYRNEIINLIGEDSHKYSEFLNVVENNEDPHKLYRTDSEEYLLYNFIIPTIADKWLRWNLNSISSNAEYQMEYSIHYQILNPEKVTVHERNSKIGEAHKFMDDLSKLFSKRNYQTENMQSEFDQQIKSFSEKTSNENFKISITGICREEDEDGKSVKYTEETRIQPEDEQRMQDEVSDKEKYVQVLSLNDKDIYERSVNEFREKYIDKIQSEEFQEAQEKISKSIAKGHLPKYLTDEDIEFLTVTLEATAQEFISIYQKKTDKTSIEYRVDHTAGEGMHKFFMNYQLLYTISDDTTFPLRDRDVRIKSIKNAIEECFERKMKDNTVHSMDDVKSFCERAVHEQSDTDIRFDIVINSCTIGDNVLN